MSVDDNLDWDALSSTSAVEDKISVSVRLRPLNDRELVHNDVSDWECIDDTTIIFKNTFQERSHFPTAYSFDRVFSPDCSTRQVYEEAAKRIALSVLSGINSTIFAYGQTSSGKTYTMSGITNYAIADIYEYIGKHREREFSLKFSALEIHNEIVKDLLSTEDTALRLLDDPEKGTVVEKLTEVTVTDSSHLKELLFICESQRKIGETILNEMSSRSHQILRLNVQSEARDYINVDNSTTLTASVNFVDLAGSERSSQTLSAGKRQKEGCHINRSLLTLGTVIRKLSKGRNRHIPFRDSKITRILQNSLGGNSKTAVICTVSPAHSHVEQSRNTLAFANCAKNVNTNAQVNIVISEKALVKQLQRELARLENELRNLSSHAPIVDSLSALNEKELLISKMDKEIKGLKHQRDQAIYRLEDYIRSEGEYSTPEMIDPVRPDRLERVDSKILHDPFLGNTEDDFLSEGTSPTMYIDKYFGPDPCRGWEKLNDQGTHMNFQDNEFQCVTFDMIQNSTVTSPVSPSKRVHQDTIEEAICDLNPNILKNNFSSPKEVCETTNDEQDVHDVSPNTLRSRSYSETLTRITRSTSSELDNENEFHSEEESDDRRTPFDTVPSPCSEYLSAIDCRSSIGSELITSCEEHIIKQLGDSLREVNDAINAELMKQYADDFEGSNTCKIDPSDSEKNNNQERYDKDGPSQDNSTKQSTSDWSSDFERQRMEIIELWSTCNIPLVHRTYFFLLFKGDPSDAVYMEVEIRRLSYLRNALHGVRLVEDDQSFTWASSSKALYRERKMLSKLMLKRFSKKDRENLYKNWGVNLKKKRRRLQVCCQIWTDTTSMEHIKESASFVAKLVGFKEPGQAPKEMFGLSLSMKRPKKYLAKSFNWRNSLYYRT